MYSQPEGSANDIKRYIEAIAMSPKVTCFVSSCLSKSLHGFEPSVHLAGVMHLPISESGSDYIALFRHECLQDIRWAVRGLASKSTHANFAE